MTVATLKQRQEAASERLQEALHGMDSAREELGRIMAAPAPDEAKAEDLQERIEALGKEAERCRLQIRALQEQLPEAQAQEAEARLAEIQDEHAPLAAEARELMQELEDLLPRAERILAALKERNRQLQDLAEEAKFLAWRHDLDAPSLEALPELKAEASVGHRIQQLIAYSRPVSGPWRQRLQDAKRQAKQKLKQASLAAEGERVT